MYMVDPKSLFLKPFFVILHCPTLDDLTRQGRTEL